MTDEQIISFKKDIKELSDKYDLEHVVIGASEGDIFQGFFCAEKEKPSPQDFFEAVCNTARLYQAAREKTLGIFNQMASRRQ